jgi:multidrug efflux pump subunit AcrA (membrane-fusion protein)
MKDNFDHTVQSLTLNALRQLQSLRGFNGESSEFWRILLDALTGLCNAKAGLICLRAGDTQAVQWKTIAMQPQTHDGVTLTKRLQDSIDVAAKECIQRGYAHIPVQTGNSIIAVNLIVDVDVHKCVALFFVSSTDTNDIIYKINSLLSVNDIPGQYRMQKSAYESIQNQSHLTDVLDILTQLNAQHKYIAAAMTVCNELAKRYSCDRISLGWFKNGYVRINAMSNTDHFEKKMEAVAQLELVMEEAFDQDADIIYPAPENSIYIARDHEIYAKAHDVKFLTTIPLRKSGSIIALITFERSSAPFTNAELRYLRVTVDQLVTRLDELKRHDRWFGIRFVDWIGKKAGSFIGYEHTWAKLAGIFSALVLLFVFLIPVRYRVDSPMILRTDDVVYITAPYDGYIDSVGVKPGDLVMTNNILLSLDNKDLLLEQASLIADRNREQREIEKARAEESLADMCISQARLDQVNVKIEINKFKLDQAAIFAPYDGVVIEGDQKEKVGSPVKQGEILFKIGRIKDIYAEAKVNESEIQNIKAFSSGQIAIASRPQDHFNIKVNLIEPSAVVADKGNVFLVRCKLNDSAPGWFRPGMTGIAKVNAGYKTIMWIISHRTIDFIRLKLWW